MKQTVTVTTIKGKDIELDIGIMSVGAVNALQEHYERITPSIYKRIVERAEKRSKKNYWDSVTLLREDIEKVLEI